MPPVCIDDVIPRDLAQPEMKRQHRVAEILAQPLAGLDQHVLDDVAGIDATGYGLVQPQADHPPQGRPVPLPELVGRRGIGLRNPVQQVLRLAQRQATSLVVNPTRIPRLVQQATASVPIYQPHRPQ